MKAQKKKHKAQIRELEDLIDQVDAENKRVEDKYTSMEQRLQSEIKDKNAEIQDCVKNIKAIEVERDKAVSRFVFFCVN